MTKKLSNSGDALSNFVNAKTKVDETFMTTELQEKIKSLMLKLLGNITPQLILLICQRFIANY